MTLYILISVNKNGITLPAFFLVVFLQNRPFSSLITLGHGHLVALCPFRPLKSLVLNNEKSQIFYKLFLTVFPHHSLSLSFQAHI